MWANRQRPGHGVRPGLVVVPRGNVGLRVLLVEDDGLLRGLTARIVRSLGHDVVDVDDGQAAIEHLATDSTIDVLFTDAKLGGALDGVELARQGLILAPDLRVVLTSGDPGLLRLDADIEDRVCTLAKPYRKEEVQALLDGFATGGGAS